MANLESIYRQAWNQYYNQRKNSGTEGQRGSRGATEKEHRSPKSNDTLRWAMARESQVSLSQTGSAFDIFMQWWVNPSECSWQVGLRSAITKTSGGAIHHEIAALDRYPSVSPNPSRFDLPMLNIAFQSGIIVEGAYNHIDNKTTPNFMSHGLGNFYDFLDLIDQPNQLADGSPNYVNILYVSPVHGAKGIWLKGFFTEDGTSWTDSADQPLQITNWRSSFLVCQSNPPLNKLRANFQASSFRSAFDNIDALMKKDKDLREKAQKEFNSWKATENQKRQVFAAKMKQESEARQQANITGQSAQRRSLEDARRVNAANLAKDRAARLRTARANAR